MDLSVVMASDLRPFVFLIDSLIAAEYNHESLLFHVQIILFVV